MEDGYKRLQQGIHYRFSQVKLLETALTHSSWSNEQQSATENNERLEFLGDAVLELTTTQELYNRFPKAHEGQLTKIRSKLVKEKSLANMAEELNLGEFLRLGKGEESQGGRERSSILADAMEAVIGAVFLDGGFEAANSFVMRLLNGKWPESFEVQVSKDFKSKLQEATQALFKDRPTYNLVNTSGPEHEKVFHVDLILPTGEVFKSEGGSLKKAEQIGAAKALQHLESIQNESS